MKVRLLLALALGTLWCCGCHKNPRMQIYIDSLNAEKRILEDKLYDLQFDCEAKEEEIEQLRKQLARLQGGAKAPAGPSTGSAPGSQLPLGNPPKPTKPAKKPSSILDLVPPKIEPGQTTESPSKGKSNTNKKQSIDEAPAPPKNILQPPKLDMGKGADSDQTNSASPSNGSPVAHIELDPSLTGGLNTDGKPGDDGLRIVLQPRSADGNYLPEPGAVSAVLLDPVNRSRVARWDWSAGEIQELLAKSPDSSGIELHADWKDQRPKTSRLHLFVRYTPPGGKTLETDREITVALPGDVATRWTPRSLPPLSPVATGTGTASAEQNPATRADASAAVGQAASQPPGAPRQAARPQWRPYR